MAVNPTFETTLAVRDACLCLHVQRAARARARRFDDALRPIGLTNGQFSLMMSLNRPKAPDTGALASLLGMDRTTLTAALKPLQSRRLLKITMDPADRRCHIADAQGAQVACRRRSRLEEDVAFEAVLFDGDPDRFRKNLRAIS